MSAQKKTDKMVKLQMIVAGLKKHLGKKALVVDGETWKPETLIARLEHQVELLQESDAARDAWLLAVAAQREDGHEIHVIVAALQAAIGVAFGVGSAAYREFGFSPRKIPSISVETRAAALEKLRATRAARHTMGRRQRKAVRAPVPSPTPAVDPTPPATGTGSNGQALNSPAKP